MDAIDREIQWAREQLRESAGSMAAIAREIEVTHSWILMFARGKIPNPTYRNLRRLLDYLRSRDCSPERQQAAA